jgi:hypothetical protein
VNSLEWLFEEAIEADIRLASLVLDAVDDDGHKSGIEIRLRNGDWVEFKVKLVKGKRKEENERRYQESGK